MTKKLWRGLFGSKTQLPQTVRAVLAAKLSRSDYEELLLKVSRREELVDVAARMLRMDPIALSGEIAGVLKVPFMPRVVPVPSAQVPLPLTHEICCAHAFVPIVAGGTLVGIVGVDPLQVPNDIGISQVTPRYLAPWSEIEKALRDGAENLAHSDIDIERLLSSATKVLQLVKRQVATYGASSAEILFDEDSIRYEFTTREGKLGQAKINSNVRVPLMKVLEELTHERGAKQAEGMGIGVSTLVPGNQYKISWALEVKEAPLSDKRVIPFDASSLTRARKEEATKNEVVVQHSKDPIKSTPLILVVDDNVTFYRVLERFFERQSMKTLYADNGEAAIKLLSSGEVKPDLIVCDVHMPMVTGFDFLKALRGKLGFIDVPVIMLTSDDDIETELRVVEGGADVYIGKNEDPRLLCAYVQRLVKRSSGKRAA